jgi:cytoskeletal protein CcmA (bactofilin family)
MFDKHRGSKTPITRDLPAAPLAAPQPRTTPVRAAVIGPGITINGDISGADDLLIEGQVKGNINLGSQEVTVGKTGQVNANITAKVIRIAGQLQGDLVGIEKVIISGTGNVRGNVVAPRVVLEDGAIFRGSIDMDPSDQIRAQPAVQGSSKPASPAETASPLVNGARGSVDLPKTADLELSSGR